jgi:acetylglutamate/LysW-gamma-L-alpha-aminoadipate kinase
VFAERSYRAVIGEISTTWQETRRIGVFYVVKAGGGAGVDLAAVAEDIAALIQSGDQVIVMHGCSHATDQLGEALAVPPRHVTSPAGIRSRYTDAEAMRVFTMAASLVNADLVTRLQRLGVAALGLSGIDGALLRGRRKDVLRIVEQGRTHVMRGNFTGRVELVNAELLRLLLAAGYAPVIAPLALSEDSEALNVDGDRAAAMVATLLRADTLVILSNVPGLLADARDERSLVQRLTAGNVADYETRVSGGMRRKLIGAREALSGGVPRVILSDGRRPHPLRAALREEGTVIA